MLTPISGYSAELLAGDRWVLELFVSDDDGSGVEEIPSFTAFLPDDTTDTPAAESLGRGFYRTAVTVADPGWYVVTASVAEYGVTAFRAHVQELVSPFGNIPVLADIQAYLGAGSTSEAVIQDALDAETQAQMDVCRIPTVYPVTLGQALKRRVARNLALRGIPLAVLEGDAETGSLTLPGRDPEVRRLEGPYKKLVQP